MSQKEGSSSGLLGRAFVSLPFDYLLIGGGLSLLMMVFLRVAGISFDPNGSLLIVPAAFILLSNSSHFASSTVRLYTKPGSREDYPFLTMAFPLVILIVLTLSIIFAVDVGKHLNAIYFTWSPYHYAAQAYGLAVMYSQRSGVGLSPSQKRVVRMTCMVPFLYAFARGANSGLGWIVPASVYAEFPIAETLRHGAIQVLAILSVCTPVLTYLWLLFHQKARVPLISFLIILSNSMWWVLFVLYDAFIWATVFHGLQYLAIVTIFHLKDQMKQPGNAHGRLYHIGKFYGLSLLLGYALFSICPYAWVMAGFGLGESMLLVTAVINIHHFIVDAYIWKSGPQRNSSWADFIPFPVRVGSFVRGRRTS